MGRRRSESERIRDRKLIARHYIHGLTQEEIAEKVGCSQATVSRDLSYLHKQWEADAAEDFNKLKGRELAQVNELARTYWSAWEESKVDTTIRGGAEDDNPQITQREGAGDPTFLAGVERCVRMRVELLGLNSPKLIGVVDEDFDQAKWAKERDTRHARALALLDEADDGEDQ